MALVHGDDSFDPDAPGQAMSQQHNPPHPGEILKDGVFTDGAITIKDFSETIGVTRAALSRVLNCRAAISPDMALRLADALGGSAESWLHMQANYDLWQARQKPRQLIKRVEIQATESMPDNHLAQKAG
jgi:antitoxin HigA-1